VSTPAFTKRLALSLAGLTSSKSRMRLVVKALSYILLISMAIVMLLPLLWLVNGSFQPSWQINANPVIWIPRAWNTVPAGDTGRKLLLWWATNPSGQRQQVIQIGVRRYTTVVDLSRLETLQSVPKSQLGAATPSTIDEMPVNVRNWATPQGVRKVVALARDPQQENNLVVAEMPLPAGALAEYPLDQINQGKLQSVQVSGFTLDARQMPDGRELLALGPESELAVVGTPEIATQARLIQAERLGKKEFVQVGQTQLAIYSVAGEPEGFRAVVLVQENWQPLLEQSYVARYGFIAKSDQLSAESETRLINGLKVTVRRYTPPDGSSPYDVAILIPGSTEFLVMPVERMDKVYAGPISDLVEPGSVNRGTLTYRVQEDLERDGRINPSALVGEIQDLALIVPASVVNDAFDVLPSKMVRSTHIALTTTGYKRVLNLKLAGVPFWRFFVNSGFVVLMNMLGHLFSCTLVAYGFARLRAPGKDLLFVILLGTMMVPGTIVTLPTYLIFRDLGLLGTMAPLWVRSFFGNAFLIFVLRQFFMTLPYELDEAAILDGASRLKVLLKVILPLSQPALATVGIFTFWWYWNSFLDPLIYISRQDQYTITLALNSFNQLYSRSAGYYDRILAGSVLSLLPMVAIFIFAQRYFIEGIQMQGLKR